MTSPRHRLVRAAPALFAVTTLPAVALAAILVGGQAAAVVAILGWFLLTPLSAVLLDEVFEVDDGDDEDLERALDALREWRADDAGSRPDGPTDSSTGDPTDERNPVDRLRERYAEGDIDEAEFERRLDLLLETEDADAETARERVRNRGGDATADREVERERER
ncbi:SHOCT domain-containing protein [Halobaculum magnesiiphilum]|uniref:SHOCT domain-containing protein n=1 Tax=Halobaculum magnesiiphilum TaxID=1017351 RepID=A0A8T8WGS5_9EURY|nr:SHOCT domain-containing protein [Halobaculum magnesiiphilum]QZP38944.1 SHOCT domain-containing protein [Halobaculum magnesiiphilum]